VEAEGRPAWRSCGRQSFLAIRTVGQCNQKATIAVRARDGKEVVDKSSSPSSSKKKKNNNNNNNPKKTTSIHACRPAVSETKAAKVAIRDSPSRESEKENADAMQSRRDGGQCSRFSLVAG
jgi:hypothetical protein